MSSKKKIGIVIVVAVLAITFMTVAFLTTQTNTDYYTQIDNRWVTDIAPHGAMNYKYTLVACRLIGLMLRSDLRYDKKLLSRHTTGSDTFTDTALITVSLRCINMTVARCNSSPCSMYNFCSKHSSVLT